VKTLVGLLATLIAVSSSVSAESSLHLSIDPNLYRISVYSTIVTAKRILASSGSEEPSTTAGYIACQGDAIALSKVDSSPAPFSLGPGICPNPLTKDVTFDPWKWPVPHPFEGDPVANADKLVYDMVKILLKNCFTSVCPAIWPT
jgi:hypothetical protein